MSSIPIPKASPPGSSSKAARRWAAAREEIARREQRFAEARQEFARAAALTRNARERTLLLGRAAGCGTAAQ